ncbi:MAG TPA: glycosyltransferase [Gemmatimonadaceae bacterium]|nr:glycosyltransferase [Gemmatimonadaceae bacterium]
MHIAIFGLTVSSSWGNGHATLWRALIRALGRLGHHTTFFERDVPYYAAARDVHALENGALVLYESWDDVASCARRTLAGVDAAIVTSYCPDAVAATRLLEDASVPCRVYYDLDTPVTLARLGAGEAVPYLPPDGLVGFDLVLSYTGGAALAALRDVLGAQRVAPLYGSVDAEVHRPGSARGEWGCDLSYIGTFAEDRQRGVERLFLGPARARPARRFVLAGSQYPPEFPWRDNVWYLTHLAPHEHPAFYASSRLTLNVTRGAMASMGWCPSGRLFEAAACGVPIVTDAWDGLDAFFAPGEEVLVARDADDVLAALDRDDDALRAMARRARERVLAQHTADRRAAELLSLLEAPVARLAASRAEA